MKLKMERPGAPGSATGANETARESFLVSEYKTGFSIRTTHFYDRASHSVEPIRDLRRVWA